MNNTKQVCLAFLLLLSTSFCLAAGVDRQSDEYSQKDSEKLRLVGRQIAENINARSYATMDSIFDKREFIRRATAFLDQNPTEVEEIRRGFIQSMPIEKIFINLFESGRSENSITAKFLDLRELDGRTKPLVRIDIAEGGHEYLELECEKSPSGEFKVVDLLVASNGQNLTASLGEYFSMMLNQPSGFIATFLNREESRGEVIKILQTAINHQRTRSFAAMYKTLQTLPESVKTSEVIQLKMIMAAANLEQEVYYAELERLAKNHGHKAKFAFTLLDYYFLKENYPQALNSVEILIKRYGEDAALLNLQATMQLMQKEFEAAKRTLAKAVALENDFESAYWTGVTASLEARNFADTVEWLNRLISVFGYVFTEEALAQEEIYKPFLASPEYRAWMRK